MGRPEKRRRVSESSKEGSKDDMEGREDGMEHEVMEGGDVKDVKAGYIASLASTPVQTKVARFQNRIQEEATGKMQGKGDKEGRK